MSGLMCSYDLVAVENWKGALRNILEDFILDNRTILLRGQRIRIHCTCLAYAHGGRTAIHSAARTTTKQFDGLCWHIWYEECELVLAFWASAIMSLKNTFQNLSLASGRVGPPSNLAEHVTPMLLDLNMWNGVHSRTQLLQQCRPSPLPFALLENIESRTYPAATQDDENGKKHNVGDNVLHNILEKFKAKSMVSRLDLPGTWPGAVGPPCERSLQNIRINEWLS